MAGRRHLTRSAGHPVTFYLVNPGDEDQWEIGFGDTYPGSSPHCTEGGKVDVTHVDADTWTIEATDQVACLDTVKYGGGDPAVIDRGHYRFPFKLTIRIP